MITGVRRAFAAILLGTLSVPLIAQDAEYTVTTEHYAVHAANNRDDARDVARRLEAFLELYNRQFRFPLEELDAPLAVRLFDSRSRYAAYLESRIGDTSSDFVYLHYSDPRRRELVGYSGNGIPERSLIHHSFVQYLRAFVPASPLWIREGFAVYFAQSRYDRGFDRAVYEENLAWLDTLKAMVRGESSRPWIAWDNLLVMSPTDAQATADSFYPQAWGLVSFLMNDENSGINRLAWDSISALDPEHSLQENSEAVYRNAFRWEDRQELQERFTDYVTSRRTFAEWVSTGIDRYGRNDRDGAEQAMVTALQLRSDHHVPFYYLGLINYDRENFETAAYYYEQALEQTNSPAPILYALGVNAIADERPEDAREYLESVPPEDSRVKEEAEELLHRLSATGSR
ncbi:MAG: hypothetical protein WD492_14900 [Alkalispirochaeta sp.]